MDLILAIIVFLIILVSTLLLWEQARNRGEQISEKRDINTQARFALQTLTQTPGNPASWDKAEFFNASQLGLTSIPFVLEESKLYSFSIWNSSFYDNYKKILGLQGYDFALFIYPYDYTLQRFSTTSNFYIGKNSSATINEKVRLERTLSMNKTYQQLVLVVWK